VFGYLDGDIPNPTLPVDYNTVSPALASSAQKSLQAVSHTGAQRQPPPSTGFSAWQPDNLVNDGNFGVIALLIAAHSTLKEKNSIPILNFVTASPNRLHHPRPVTTQDKGKAGDKSHFRRNL